MTERRATLAHTPADRPRLRSRIWLTVLGALLILALGIVIGNRLGGAEQRSLDARTEADAQSPHQSVAPPATVVPPDPATPGSVSSRTEAGAAAAASAAIGAFDLPVVLDDERLRSTIAAIAARKYREPLLETYRAGAASFREQLGIGSTPEPVVFVRTTPVGFRVERFTPAEATVAVWTVGLVGSGATVTPQQTWSTQRVSLTWESGAWKVSGFHRETGPTPPLARAEAADAPGTLFEAIPSFEPYRHATP